MDREVWWGVLGVSVGLALDWAGRSVFAWRKASFATFNPRRERSDVREDMEALRRNADEWETRLKARETEIATLWLENEHTTSSLKSNQEALDGLTDRLGRLEESAGALSVLSGTVASLGHRLDDWEARERSLTTDHLRPELEALEQRVARLEGAERPSTPRVEEPLAVVSLSVPKESLARVPGIGEEFEKRLNDAGIRTLSDLAATRPERLLEILQPAEWQRIDPERWVASATELLAKSGT